MDKPFEEMTPFEQKQQKARTIFQKMQETIRANQAKFLNHSYVRKEAKKEMMGADLDASIAKEAEREIKKITLPPIPEIKINQASTILESVYAEEPEEDFIEETAIKEKQEAVEESPSSGKKVFLPPNPANTDLSDLMDALDVVSKYLNNAKNEVLFLEESINDANSETSDFLHSIELSQFDAEEKIDIFNKVKEIRQRRRSYKARLEYLKVLEAFISNNQNIANKINTLRGQLKHVKERQDTARFYTRIRTDIKEDELVHIGNRASA